MLSCKNINEKGERQSKIWLNIVLGENFGSMNVFDFRVELKWVFLANHFRYSRSLFYYCAFIYCYSWYLCVFLLCLGALIKNLIVHGVILPDKETVPTLESLTLKFILAMCLQSSGDQVAMFLINSHPLGEVSRRWLSVNLNAH